MKKNNKKNRQSGQVLLLAVMLLATVLTISLTVTLRSTTETQITKLEEENQKALAAAEAAIEKALQSKQQGSFAAIGLSDLSGINLSESSVDISNQQGNTFITPLLQKDEQYTFYLTSYNPQNKTLGTTSTSQNIHICFGSSSSRPAIEITLIKTNGIKKYAVNPQGNVIINNGSAASAPGTDCPDNTFTDRYSINSVDIGTNSQLLIVRVINGTTKIGFKANSNFPLQGSTITSTAKSIGGVVKKVKLFQSYPQIPADFFVTSF